MKNNPLVTVITPCYNGELFLHQYFDSILAQTYDNIELVFVNDGSSDCTEKIALSYQDALKQRGIRYIYLKQENGGQAKAINTGLKHMSGTYLVWPDSDDWLSPDSIEKRVAFLETHPDYDMVRSNAELFDFDTKQTMGRISESDNRFNEDIFLDLILEKTYCCCGCYMIRSDALKNIYPDLIIYASKAGQNWQILIPVSGRSLCGFIDEDLYHIASRNGSHSRRKRTLSEQAARIEEFRRILKNAVEKSGRTDRDYNDIIDAKTTRLLFWCYIEAESFTEGKRIYKELKKEGQATFADWIRVHPLIYKNARAVKRIVKRIVNPKVVRRK